jgi:hypothetical protein
MKLVFLVLILAAPLTFADTDHGMHAHHHGHSPNFPAWASDCGENEVWDVPMGMCMPLAQADLKMLMISGNIFGGATTQSGPRGRTDIWSTNMVMFDAGMSLGERHYLNLDLMATAELWTVPRRGYPLLLQTGEEDEDHIPFLDAQHPHSSPIMGLTLSDTIRLDGTKNYLKLFFAPRGETTDGPIAFMHRVTGAVNPDAPLGHHIGQDVGHITSTVLGAALSLGGTRLELSAFHGEEPEPTKVNLPLGSLNSGAVRLTQELGQDFYGMASFAYAGDPEPHATEKSHVTRYSASLYKRFQLSDTWVLDDSLIWGGISQYDHASFLNSFAEEFLLRTHPHNIWGRIEVLQRTPNELVVLGFGTPSGDTGQWVTAVTLGYTLTMTKILAYDLGMGGSFTVDFLPSDYRLSYGTPLTGKIFLQVKGMGMVM